MLSESLMQIAYQKIKNISFGKFLTLLCLGLSFAQLAAAQTVQVFTGDSWSEFPGGAKAVCADGDIDNDNDGLIEMCYLEDVFNMRHQNEGTGCPNDVCSGYELVRDLDFQDDDSYISTSNKVTWTTGEGWSNMGNFAGILEGNGHSISNLFQNRARGSDDELGFINRLNTSGQIRNLNFLKMNVGKNLNRAESYFVYFNDGKIINCYIQGKITERPSGLRRALLIYENRGEISNINANLQVQDIDGVAMIRENFGKLSDSSFQLTINVRGYQGIIKLANKGNRAIISNNLYIISTNVGHPIIRNNILEGTIENSYWDADRGPNLSLHDPNQNLGTITNFRGFTTKQLQSPMGPNMDIATSSTQPYYLWSEDNWNFGTSEQYPAVKYARGSDSNNPACDISQQPKCETLLRHSRNAQPQIISPTSDTEIILVKGEESRISMVVSDDDEDDRLTVEWSAVAMDGEDLITTSVQVPPSDDALKMFDLRIRIPDAVATSVTQLRLVARDDSGHYNAQSEAVLLDAKVEDNTPPIIAGINVPKLIIDEASTQSISVQVINTQNQNLTYQWSGDTSVLSHTDRNPVIFSTPPNFVAAASTSTTLNLKVEVSDGTFSTTAEVTLVVKNVNNGSATIADSIEIGSNTTTLTVTILSGDPDGDPSEAVMYQWQVCSAVEGICPEPEEDNWKNIVGATAEQYVVREGTFSSEDGSRIFRVIVSYTDGQDFPEEIDILVTLTIGVSVKVFLEGLLE